MTWKQMTEEERYAAWSFYVENSVHAHLNYSEYCDVRDRNEA